MGALRAGARGYLVKSASAEELLSAAKAVSRGGTYLHERVAAPVLRELQGTPAATERAPFSERQVAILRWVAEGLSNRSIADELNISVSTIKGQVQELFRRFGVTDRTHLVVKALEQGVLCRSPEEEA